MKADRPLIIWDFDGTLAYREGGMWSATLAEVVNASGYCVRQLLPADFTPYYCRIMCPNWSPWSGLWE
jgi:hypothetical protein